MKERVECSVCHRVYAVKKYATGDHPHRHQHNGVTCPGTHVQGIPVCIKKVVRIDRSPMNDLVWVIQLECKHDVFKTSRLKPRIKELRCDKCER